MVDQEVVDTIEEIRNRVRSGAAPSINSNLQSTLEDPRTASPLPFRTFAGLSVLGRTWDRLPPVVSNRSGAPARLELWIKRQCKRALRWFTWEQVNFNAATLQTFREVVDALTALEREATKLQAQLATCSATNNQLRSDFEVISAGLNQHRDANHRLQLGVQTLTESLATLESEKSELQAQVARLTYELGSRDERFLDELRVCFKQLSLETGEAVAAQERVRCQLEARLDKLEQGKA